VRSLTGLLQLAGVAEALAAAREAADRAFGDLSGATRGGNPQVATEVGLRSAVASAALEGHSCDIDAVRAGAVTDPVVQGALRASAAVVALAPIWGTAPRQALARLHVLAARGCVGDESLGRPLPSAVPRLDLLCRVVEEGAGTVPALLRAAVVHGELLALRPFVGPNGVLARAAGRLTMISDGLDPHGLLAVEVGHLARQPEYVGAANAFSTGTPDGVRAWLRHCAGAVDRAAQELASVAQAVRAAG
jgi:hypothetical protein